MIFSSIGVPFGESMPISWADNKKGHADSSVNSKTLMTGFFMAFLV